MMTQKRRYDSRALLVYHLFAKTLADNTLYNKACNTDNDELISGYDFASFMTIISADYLNHS